MVHRCLARLLLVLLAPVIGAPGSTTLADETRPSLQLGPILGAVGPDRASIWLKATAQAASGVIIAESADLEAGRREVTGPPLTVATDFAGVVEVTDLRPATTYLYQVALDDVPAVTPPSSFVTAPPAGTTGQLRFATISCVGPPELSARSWAALADVPVDLLLQLGDNAYVDSTEPARHRQKFYAQRAVPAYRAIAARTPTLAIWDDWDYAGNNSDGTEAGKARSLRTFEQLWPNPSFGQADDPGVYFRFSWGDVDFFMLDGRYHRSPNDLADAGDKTMLGASQLSWLKRELLASEATFKFLVSGGQWESRGRTDSWASFTRERNELLQFLRDREISGVVLLSGDRHVTAGYQVQGRFIEITSSPFAAENHEPPYNPAEMFMLHDDGQFFVIFAVKTLTAPPSLTIEVHQVGTGIVHQRRFSWEEINGRVRIPTCALLIDCRR
jgi:alkaline phosphatase D